MDGTLRTARLCLVPADVEELRVKYDGPDADGLVEIAYGIDEAFQGHGYATEAAAALVDFAFADPRVRVVCAHTLCQAAASPRVLEKCGFTHVGEVVDPEDGPVWRFEKRRPT